MKRILLFSAFLLCTMLSLAADFTVDGLSYNITSTTDLKVEVTKSLTQPSGNLTIPASVEYGGKTYTVTGIGYQAFNFSFNLTSVIIPNTYAICYVVTKNGEVAGFTTATTFDGYTEGDLWQVQAVNENGGLSAYGTATASGTTAIETVESTLSESVAMRTMYYDLQGRMVTNPSKGVFIHNGKKVVIK